MPFYALYELKCPKCRWRGIRGIGDVRIGNEYCCERCGAETEASLASLSQIRIHELKGHFKRLLNRNADTVKRGKDVSLPAVTADRVSIRPRPCNKRHIALFDNAR